MSTETIELVGHGWVDLPPHQNPVTLAAKALTKMGHRAVARFLTQEPRFAAPDGNSIIVPFFMSDGHSAAKITTQAGDATVLTPIGLMDGFNTIVDAAIAESRFETLVIVGHGTLKTAASKQGVLRQVERLTATGIICHAAFLEEPPALDEVIDGALGRVVVLPFFVAPGHHTQHDIPKLLAGSDDVEVLAPVGLSPRIPVMILQAALAHRGNINSSEQP